SSVVVPGHGAVVDREFVEDQRNAIGVLAETIRDLAGQGVPASQALESASEWPFPVGHLTHAIARTYEQLPRSQKRLPLI
ncbi:MAG: MBL fold metallo-hydrolase, partial [Nocardioides sp.]